jgi:hypothetical protein
MAENTSVANLLNPAASKCPNFEGTTCVEWLTFLPQWKMFMHHHVVDEIILKGTYKKLPYLTLQDDDGPSVADTYLRWSTDKAENMRKTLKVQIYDIFIKQDTWAPYVISRMKVPVGAHSGEATIRMPFTATNEFDEVATVRRKLVPFGEMILFDQIREGTDTDPVLPTFFILDMAEKAASCIANHTYLRFKNVHEIMAGNPNDAVNPIPAMKIQVFLKTTAKLTDSEIAEIFALNKIELKDCVTL